MKILGITGGVGSGKSRVLYDINKICNAYIIETDKLAHELMEPGQIIYNKIVDTFGKDILCEDEPYYINRAKLGEIVFNDKNKLMQLNNITHPGVKDYIKSMINSIKAKGSYDLFVIEAALLIQDGYKEICDEIWYVYVSDEERIKRLMESRNYTREKCISIINSQESVEYYKNNTDNIIYNDGSYEETFNIITELLNKFISNDIIK